MASNPTPTRPTFPQLSEGQGKVVLLLGTVLGMVLVGVGIFLSLTWWNTLTAGMEEWHKKWWQLMLIELSIFGGLAVMFLSLQLARSEERTNAGMRRLVYGYNAGLTALLLLTILGHLNVASYLPIRPFTYMQAAYDWTEGGLYTLSPESKKFLEQLKEPVKVYVLLPQGLILDEVRTLLNRCKVVTNKLDFEELSPDLSQDRIRQLVEKYQVPERMGILVVYGTDPAEKYEFIKTDDIFSVKGRDRFNRSPDQKESVEFKGESALISTLNFLTEGKARPSIYFTQGDGELDLNDSASANRDDQGLGLLREQLTRAKYDIKELKLGIGTDKVPDDAAIVVIARPTMRLPEPALDALREYMKPKDTSKKPGKLLVLLDVQKGQGGQMEQTGLEGFLREFGVQVGNERIVCLGNPNPLDVTVAPNPRSENPVIAPYQGFGFRLHDVRTVEPMPASPNSPSPYQVESLLFAHPRFGIYKEPNLNADVLQNAKALLKPERRDELAEKVSREPFSLAVAVTEPAGGKAEAGDPHAFMKREQQPRMLVFGDATWVSNRRMGDTGQLEMFTGSLAWLRDRPDVGTISQPPKERKAFAIKSSDPNGLFWRMILVPMCLLMVGIIGLGAGVWVVRRR